MKFFFIILVIFFSFSNLRAQEVINTIAGDGTHAYSGDGGPASAAEFQYPITVCQDTAGNLYILDLLYGAVREIDAATGDIATIAGSEALVGNTGDGGPAIDATLDYPTGICVDRQGFIYIADNYNNRVRKINPSNMYISTIAGHDTASFTGDGGLAVNALLNAPSSVAVDDSGNVYIDDSYNNRIRKISISSGIINTIGGNGIAGYSGDGGLATSAEIDTAITIAADHSGNVYIVDDNNYRIRKISVATGIISTIAGTGISGYSGDGGPATSAELVNPIGISVDDSNNIYIADQAASVIRKITAATGIINTIVGNGTAGFLGDGGSPTAAELNYATGVCTNGAGTIINIADKGNGRIRQVSNSSVSVKQIRNNKLSIFPNPSNGIFSIEDDGTLVVVHDIKIVNRIGLCIYQNKTSSSSTEINIAGAIPGVYFLYDNTPNGRSVYEIFVGDN